MAKAPKGEGVRRDRSSGDQGHTVWGKITKALFGGGKGSAKGWEQPGGKRRGRFDNR